MKFTDAQRVELAIALAPAIVALRFTKAPAPRNGEAKPVSVDFAAAVWTRRYLETIVKVLEKDQGAEPSSESGGFPS